MSSESSPAGECASNSNQGGNLSPNVATGRFLLASPPKQPPPPPRRIPVRPYQNPNTAEEQPLSKPKSFVAAGSKHTTPAINPNTAEFNQHVNTLVSRALASQQHPSHGSGSSTDIGEGALSFSASTLRNPPPPLPNQPSVSECLYAARHFDESWYSRSAPPVVAEEIVHNETPTQRNKRLKTTTYRQKSAEVPPAVQREEFLPHS